MSVIESVQAIRSIHVYEHRGPDFKPEPIRDVLDLSNFLAENVSTPWIALFGLRGAVNNDYSPLIEKVRGRVLFDDELSPKIITPPGENSSLVTLTVDNHGLDLDGIRSQLLMLESGINEQLF